MTSVEIPRSVAAALPTLSVFDITNDVSRAISASGHEAGLAYVAADVAARSRARDASASRGSSTTSRRCSRGSSPTTSTERERLIVALLGSRTEQIPFVDGRLCLGQWQRVLLFGFNGDASADFALTLLG